jgi:hypothetical protein
VLEWAPDTAVLTGLVGLVPGEDHDCLLLAGGDATQVRIQLRTLPNGAHIETQITPLLGPRDATVTRHGWRYWRAHRPRISSTGAANPHLFAEPSPGRWSGVNSSRRIGAECRTT